MLKTTLIYIRAIRVNQWTKNLAVFIAIIFSGNLFNGGLFLNSVYVFFLYCLLSSTSYLLNDVIDIENDRKHPVKKHRPIASGLISVPQATFLVFVFTIISLILSLIFSPNLFFVSLFFIVLHFLYSLYFKRFPVIDIFFISFSFMLRAFAGEVATGFHIPIWLFLTIFFASLFMGAAKRHAEYVAQGTAARESLKEYGEYFITFLTNLFGTSTVIAYACYTYFEKPPETAGLLTPFVNSIVGGAADTRKWMMVTIPVAVYGIARYAQLVYEQAKGERPEKIIVSDMPLIVGMAVWGIIIIALIYVI